MDVNGFSAEKDRKTIESVLARHPEIEWGIDWKATDPPHFQIRNWSKGLSFRENFFDGGYWVWLVIAVLILLYLNR
ncbi:hypothetical protein LEP1GSC191_4192 [Leptospira borgpetersenii serovar Mini str. 201000851]|uniref:Serine-type D-Ala-D-Ala carboxypeptidase n=2 Tax=Leptospira borgpetersenii TaxID=174 RepID=M3HJB1_LEPBO|nr:hypothetical protein LEP1GSC128_1016 [Leptospira borgpetersenii str. 200801926]EMF97769.1 hypothetical protein LEP1GSC123_0905 [Leptospira borgpetersenii str. 200701203]ENO63028.1 hypothetical protein LEP1GSC191_4192 [Leptospira borgpetersenii serovar Mini str. 201000851]